MRPGPRTIRSCPHCSEPFEEPTIASGNTFGAKIWSDGKMDAPMLPEHHAFVSCPSCNEPFWVKNSEIIEALDFDDLDQTEYPNTAYYLKPTPEAYLKGLSNLAITNDEENSIIASVSFWPINFCSGNCLYTGSARLHQNIRLFYEDKE